MRPQAIKSLLDAQGSDAPPSVRRSAARRLLQLCKRYREAITIEKRVAALEQQLPEAGSQAYPTTPEVDPFTATASTPNLRVAATPTARKRPPRKWHDVLHALAHGATAAKAAAHAKVSEPTVHRRLANPDFCERLRTLKAEMVQRTTALLLTTAPQACQTLIDLLAPTIPINVRCAAAGDRRHTRVGLVAGGKPRVGETMCPVDLLGRRSTAGARAIRQPGREAPVSRSIRNRAVRKVGSPGP